MSIRSLVFVAPLFTPATLIAMPATAQDQAAPETQEPSAAQVAAALIARAKEVTSLDAPVPERPADCAEVETAEDGGTIIVVCAPVEDDPESFRGRSRLDRGDDSHLSYVGGTPNLEPVYPGPVVARGCFIPPCPPPPVYYIDVTALPEAPPGSDADRIARGLAPRGSSYDAGVPAAETGIVAQGSPPPEEERVEPGRPGE